MENDCCFEKGNLVEVDDGYFFCKVCCSTLEMSVVIPSVVEAARAYERDANIIFLTDDDDEDTQHGAALA